MIDSRKGVVLVPTYRLSIESRTSRKFSVCRNPYMRSTISEFLNLSGCKDIRSGGSCLILASARSEKRILIPLPKLWSVRIGFQSPDINLYSLTCLPSLLGIDKVSDFSVDTPASPHPRSNQLSPRVFQIPISYYDTGGCIY